MFLEEMESCLNRSLAVMCLIIEEEKLQLEEKEINKQTGKMWLNYTSLKMNGSFQNSIPQLGVESSLLIVKAEVYLSLCIYLF